MVEPFFLTTGLSGQLVQPTFAGDDRQANSAERVLWQGHTAVAEFALSDEEASSPRWSLPETTEVTITDRRIAYAHVVHGPGVWPPLPQTPESAIPTDELTTGETRWLWPQHLRVQPGPRAAGSVSEIHLVCGPADDHWPTVVLAGGDLTTVAEADRVANLLRRAIVQFRLDNAHGLSLSTPQARMLSRLLITPEFRNHPGGAGQTVSLPGAFPLTRTTPTAPYFVPESEAHTVQLDHLAPVARSVPLARTAPRARGAAPAPSPPLGSAPPLGSSSPLGSPPLGSPPSAALRQDLIDTVDLTTRASQVVTRVAEMVRTSGLAVEWTARGNGLASGAAFGPASGLRHRL